MAGCDRKTDFETVEALRNHISHPTYRHKLEGVFTSNDQAIELCGKVAPGQEGFDTVPNVRSNVVAPVANMTRSGFLTPETSSSGSYDSDIGARFGATTQASAHLDGRSSTPSAAHEASDLGFIYRTLSAHPGTSTNMRTRAQQAAKVFDGYLSSESESDEEGETTEPEPIAPLKNDQHITDKVPSTPAKRQLVEADLYDMCAETVRQSKGETNSEALHPAIKCEHDGNPSLSLEQSPIAPSWSRITSRSLSMVSVDEGLGAQDKAANGGYDASQTRKRPASSLLSTPTSLGKRSRISTRSSSI